MRIVAALMLMASWLLSASSAAQTLTPSTYCKEREEDFEILSGFDITDKGIGNAYSFFNNTVKEVLDAVAPDYTINVTVTNCPVFGHPVRSVDAMSFPLLEWKGNTFVSVPSRHYTLYVTAYFLQITIHAEVVEVIRREVCIIASGGAQDFDRPSVVEDTAKVLACIRKAQEAQEK
jgi:hypothetical protein